ncbi:MAG: FecR domain-containing protein [Spirochaetales bacterium]|nr:FecR domain-containing protein [Spirochaetales bacterium]
MKRTDKIILVFGLIIAFSIAGAILLIINLTNGYTEREVSLQPFTAPQAKEAIVTFFSGEVFFFRNNEWKPVSIGEILKENDYIKTFENSYCEIQIGEKISFSMRENALIKLYVVLQTEDTTQSDSEILIGTVLYKVMKLGDNDDMVIRAGTRAFGVRGTEFFIDRSIAKTTCAVLSGAVAVIDPESKREAARIASRREIILHDKTDPPPAALPLSNISSSVLENIKTVKQIKLAGADSQKLIKIGIAALPSTAEIYVDSQLAGNGIFAGIYNAGTEIAVRLHSPGYKDQSFVITAKQGENRIYKFKLELEKPELGIDRTQSGNEIEEKIKSLEQQIKTLSIEKDTYRSEIERLKKDKITLEQQLKEANVKIKDAIKQLQ